MLVGPEGSRPKHATLIAALEAASVDAVAGDGLVFVGLDESESFHRWSEIRERAERAAAELARRGIAPGDRVAIVLPTSLAFMDAFFGTLLAGAVPVPLYPPMRLGFLDEYQEATIRMLRTVGAELVIIDVRVRPVLGVVIERAGCTYVPAEALTAGTERLTRERRSNDLGLIQFSSGSTVDPKAVALTHAQLLAQCAVLYGVMNGRADHTRVGASWLPLYHDMGLIGCLLSAVYHPGRLVLIAPEHFLAKPALWLRAIARHRAFISPAPNFAYSLCAKRVRDRDLEGVDLSCWRLALNGAEPVLASTLDEFTKRFSRFGFSREALLPVYGLSETALAVTVSASPPAVRHRGPDHRDTLSVGVPVRGFAVTIRDERGREVDDGCEGHIVVRGPSVMHGYFGDPEATRRVLHDGWLDTGDLGFVDAGQLFVSGRAKDLIIIRGANRMPQEFEEPLLDVAGVRAGCVVAAGETFDTEGGEGLCIFAERAKGAARADAEIAAAITKRLIESTGVRPSLIRILAPGTLPRTSSGKLRRAETVARHRTGTLTPAKRVTVWSMAAAMLRSVMAYARIRLRSEQRREQPVEARP